MNRGRGLMGPNSYVRELGFNPLDFLKSRGPGRPLAWLDLCCGSGRALVEAAERLELSRPRDEVLLVGVDLVPQFDPLPRPLPQLRLVAASLAAWSPELLVPVPPHPVRFDLITCVHGLHYVGDKLGLIGRAAAWLKPDGRFVAHLDPAHLRWNDEDAAGPHLLRELRAAGLRYEARRHLLTCEGPRALALSYSFVGADDRAGPNYTGQEAVASYYRRPTPCT